MKVWDYIKQNHLLLVVVLLLLALYGAISTWDFDVFGALGKERQLVQLEGQEKWLSALQTSTALDNGNSWNSGWVDTNGYSAIKIAVKTDQNGQFKLEYSVNASDVDSTLTRYYRTANIEPPHKFENMRRYVKVTYTNDSGSNQTYLRLQGALTNSSGILNVPEDSTMSPDYDAISTRPTDFTIECALGRRQGCLTWNKFGYNTDVDTATDPEIIASWGGTFQYLTSGEYLNFASTDATDTTGGLGARQVIIYGVDENWNEVTEILTLAGTSSATTTNQYIGVNRFAVYTAGASTTNNGTITATASTSGYTIAQMPANQGTTQQCVFYVPADTQFLASWLVLNALKEGPSTAPIVTFKGFVYSDVVASEFEVYRGSEDTNASTDLILNPAEPFVIGEKSILWFTAETTQNDTSVRCRFSGKLIKDVDA